VSATEISAYDLYITHAETGADARHVPRRGACKDMSGCEYARQIEKYNLTVRPVPPAGTTTAVPDPNRAWPAYEQWKTDAHALVTDVVPLVSGGDARLAELRARLSAWIAPDKRPPYQFGFLADQIARLTANENQAAHLVFWLLQDGRARLLSCHCAEVPTDPAVLLARLWLLTKQDEQGRLSCQVFDIDSMPPHRRPLRLDPCWPTPPNQVNLGRWIGASLDDPNSLKAALAEWGITAVDPSEVTYSFGDLGNFNTVIDAPLIVQRVTKLTAIKYLDMGPLGRRVVAFLT
jgi:hypothetical protein